MKSREIKTMRVMLVRHGPCDLAAPMRRMAPPPVQIHTSLDDLRVVALGGGTGLPIVLEGLKDALPGHERDRLTAVVTVADDGGSSGRLRHAYGVLPPGDIRNCLLALTDRNSTLAAIFNHRFDGSDEVSGHSLGNLILTALSQIEKDFPRAIERGSEILNVRGRVFPATAEDVRLRAELADGSCIEGESQINSVPRTIRSVSLEPSEPAPFGAAIEAALRAGLVILGPGSLYTSLIPVLLIKELADAIRRSGARVVLVMNLTTQPGETDGYTAADHVLAIRRHAPDVPIHDVLLNSTPIPEDVARAYSASHAVPVAPDVELLRALGYRPVMRDLLGSGPKIRHDPYKLAAALLGLVRRTRPGVETTTAPAVARSIAGTR
jgi:uncharacterized cofD-like protein